MKKVFYSFAVLLSLFGCAVASDTSLKGKEFNLKGTNITLIFEETENKFYGKAVNNYFGIYTLDGDNLRLELQGSTMMMGEPQKMEQETKYFNNLNEITSYSLDANTLILKGRNLELTFEKQ